MPLLKESYNPAVQEALVRLAGQAATDAGYFQQEAQRALHQLRRKPQARQTAEPAHASREAQAPAVVLDRRGLKDLHPALGTRVIALALQEAGMRKDLSEATLLAAWELLQRGRGVGIAQFAGGYTMTLDHDLVRVGKTQ